MANKTVFNDRLTVRLPHSLALKLHVYSTFTGEQKLNVATQAIREYLDARWDNNLGKLEDLWTQKENAHE